MSLNAIILAGMISLTPEAYRPQEGSERYEAYLGIASDIENAVQMPLGILPFEGPAAEEATADALVAIAANESSYDQKVRDCRRKGDHGMSISVFQLYRGASRGGYREKDICADPVLAAKLAINVLGWYQYTGSTNRLFNGYATGEAERTNYAAQRQHRLFQKLIQIGHIKVSKKNRKSRLWAEYEPHTEVSSVNDVRPWISSFASGFQRLPD